MEMSEISFKKLPDGSFGIRVAKTREVSPGESLTVARKDGTESDVIVGEFVSENSYGDKLYRIRK